MIYFFRFSSQCDDKQSYGSGVWGGSPVSDRREDGVLKRITLGVVTIGTDVS